VRPETFPGRVAFVGRCFILPALAVFVVAVVWLAFVAGLRCCGC